MSTKDTVLALFEKNKGFFISGEKIAEELNISRTAVWKAVKKLQSEGYDIKAITNRGYCLNKESDVLTVRGIRSHLDDNCSDLRPEVFVRVDSTNTKCIEKAAEGESDILRCRTTWLFAWITKAYLKGAGKEALSYLFHAALAVMAGMTCIRIREDTGIRTVALSGGVYQNQLLLRLSTGFLEQADFQVLIHSLLPPNDGGICLGQAVYGARYLARVTQ